MTYDVHLAQVKKERPQPPLSRSRRTQLVLTVWLLLGWLPLQVLNMGAVLKLNTGLARVRKHTNKQDPRLKNQPDYIIYNFTTHQGVEWF